MIATHLIFYRSQLIYMTISTCKFSACPFQCGDRLYTSVSDVCRRQMLTYKDDPRTEGIKIFIIVVVP